MSRLRVGIDIHIPDHVESGQQRYLRRLGGWLAGRDHEVHFLTTRPQDDSVSSPSGTRLHRLHEATRRELRRHVRSLQLDVLLLNPERARRYRGLGANVLRPGYGTDHYRQNLRSFRTGPGALARRILRFMPWVLAERRWERRFYEATDPPPEVVAISRYMRGEIMNSYSVPDDHVHVIHNGVDLDEFSPARRARLRDETRNKWSLPRDAVCLLFMGHNFRRKGLWPLLRVLARLRESMPEKDEGGRDVHLLVAGSGTGEGQRRKARRLVHQHGIKDAVHLLGPVRPADQAFAAADIFLQLTWHDAFGFVSLEAMASGLPVVTTPYAGASELIEDGVSGVIVDPGDERAIAERLRTLISSERRFEIGEAAAGVARDYSEESNFSKILDVMRIAAERAAGPVR